MSTNLADYDGIWHRLTGHVIGCHCDFCDDRTPLPELFAARYAAKRVASYNLIRTARGFHLAWGALMPDGTFTGPAALIPIEDYEELAVGQSIPVDLVRTDMTDIL